MHITDGELCDVCMENTETVEIGTGYCYESGNAALCAECLKKALAMLGEKV